MSIITWEQALRGPNAPCLAASQLWAPDVGLGWGRDAAPDVCGHSRRALGL